MFQKDQVLCFVEPYVEAPPRKGELVGKSSSGKLAALAVHSHDNASGFCLVLQVEVFPDVGLGALPTLVLVLWGVFAHHQVEAV